MEKFNNLKIGRIRQFIGAAVSGTIVTFILLNLIYYFITGDLLIDVISDNPNNFNRTTLHKIDNFR